MSIISEGYLHYFKDANCWAAQIHFLSTFPEEMIAPVRNWIEALYLVESELGFAVIWNAWENLTAVVLDQKITVTPHRNGHLDQCYGYLSEVHKVRPCNSYSLEIETTRARLIFSGDLASPEELTSLLKNPTKLLVSELSHFSKDQLAAVLSGASIETLCLVHLSEEYSANRSEIQITMEERLPSIKNVIIPEDGEVLDF